MADRRCHYHFTFSQVIKSNIILGPALEDWYRSFIIVPTMFTDDTQVVSIPMISFAMGTNFCYAISYTFITKPY